MANVETFYVRGKYFSTFQNPSELAHHFPKPHIIVYLYVQLLQTQCFGYNITCRLSCKFQKRLQLVRFGQRTSTTNDDWPFLQYCDQIKRRRENRGRETTINIDDHHWRIFDAYRRAVRISCRFVRNDFDNNSHRAGTLFTTIRFRSWRAWLFLKRPNFSRAPVSSICRG